jgi:hypothetical protein
MTMEENSAIILSSIEECFRGNSFASRTLTCPVAPRIGDFNNQLGRIRAGTPAKATLIQIACRAVTVANGRALIIEASPTIGALGVTPTLLITGPVISMKTPNLTRPEILTRTLTRTRIETAGKILTLQILTKTKVLVATLATSLTLNQANIAKRVKKRMITKPLRSSSSNSRHLAATREEAKSLL